MLPPRVIDLDATYRRLARPWTREQLAADYRSAHRDGEHVADALPPPRPIPLLAAAIAPSATVNTAIHILHALPRDVDEGLPEQLLDTAQWNVVAALQRCHEALELDGAGHGYTVEEWLPTVYDITGPLLEAARLDAEPPTLVEAAQQAISWLSRAITDLDERPEEVPNSVAETLARHLAVLTFTDVARSRQQSV